MRCNIRHILVIFFTLALSAVAMAQEQPTTKAERNAIKEANKFYNEKQYERAIELYDKVLATNPALEVAQYNLAMTRLGLGAARQDSIGLKMMQQADSVLLNLGQHATTPGIAEKSLYNLGNVAFNQGDYLEQMGGGDKAQEFFKQAIGFYQQVLRQNPANELARQNLRIAQLRLKESENQDQDQDKQQQQQQQQQQEQEQQQQQQPPQPKEQKELEQNSEQILRAMQNQENATRRKAEQKPVGRAGTDKPW